MKTIVPEVCFEPQGMSEENMPLAGVSAFRIPELFLPAPVFGVK